MSNKEIAQKFADRKPNKKHKGRVVWSGNNVYCIDDLIFSYGSHFPMAKYLGEKDGKRFFIKNNDKYSSSTSAHQSYVRSYCEGPSLSRNGFSKYVHFEDLTMENIHLWRPGFLNFIWKDTQTGLFYHDFDYRTLDLNDPDPTDPFMSIDKEPNSSDLTKAFKVVNLQRRVCVFTKPFKNQIGEFKASRKQDYQRFQSGVFSLEEALVLKVSEIYLLATGSKIVELSGEPKTIAQALKMTEKKKAA